MTTFKKPDAATVKRIQLAVAGGQPLDDIAEGLDPRAVRDAIQSAPVAFRAVCGIPNLSERQVVIRELGQPDEHGVVGELEFIASSEAVARDGSIIRLRPGRKDAVLPGGRKVTPGGMRTANFIAAGGPVLWGHNRDIPPVGFVSERPKVRNLDVDGKSVPVLLERVAFTPDEDLPISKTVARLVLGSKRLRTVSIGWHTIEIDPVIDPERRAQLGLGPWGVVYLTCDQVELSITPTPSDPLAMSSGRAAEDSIAREVIENLRRYREQGILSRTEHDEIAGLLVPISGEARAADKVRGFVEFLGPDFRERGLWPSLEGVLTREEATAPTDVIEDEEPGGDAGQRSEAEVAEDIARHEQQHAEEIDAEPRGVVDPEGRADGSSPPEESDAAGRSSVFDYRERMTGAQVALLDVARILGLETDPNALRADDIRAAARQAAAARSAESGELLDACRAAWPDAAGPLALALAVEADAGELQRLRRVERSLLSLLHLPLGGDVVATASERLEGLRSEVQAATARADAARSRGDGGSGGRITAEETEIIWRLFESLSGAANDASSLIDRLEGRAGSDASLGDRSGENLNRTDGGPTLPPSAELRELVERTLIGLLKPNAAQHEDTLPRSTGGLPIGDLIELDREARQVAASARHLSGEA